MEIQHGGTSTLEIPLAKRAELSPEDQRWVIEAEGRVFGVFLVDGEFYAYENRCPHQGGPVCKGRVMPAVNAVVADDGAVVHEFTTDEQHLVCPWHGWEFHLTTGRCVTDERFGLRKLKVVDRDGELFLQA
jgi:nitrite reductase (NADH) small subunit